MPKGHESGLVAVEVYYLLSLIDLQSLVVGFYTECSSIPNTVEMSSMCVSKLTYNYENGRYFSYVCRVNEVSVTVL